jgi:hypothetical protein
MMKTWALFSGVSNAFSGTSQLMDRNMLRDQAFLAMSLFHVLGLLLWLLVRVVLHVVKQWIRR